jgi:hypothetical protein
MKTTLTTITLAIGLFANAQNALLDSSFLQGKKTTSRKPTTAVDDSEPSKKLDPNRLVFGGNIGASFGDFTFVNLSPQVGYAFKPWLTAGAGINYIYNSFKYRDFNGNDTDYRNDLAEREKEQRRLANEAANAAKKAAQAGLEKPKVKLSFKDKYELEQLDKEIPALEKEKVELEAKMMTITDHAEIMKTSARIGEIINALDNKGLRWLELTEMAG